ncbi:MAG TPA: UvrD-helicase domain-containing protein [Acidimicrobiales bacterium]|nr:UvrD-helicase domain-containing protein [Acidimicrobiales bacterium]
MASHPELQEEQAHIDRAYERVAALRAAASELLETVLRQRGGTPGSFAERDVIVRTTLQRLEQLDVGRESLCFGRIDRRDRATFHIGRLAVSGEDQEPLVVDWRAPVAEPFYRATGVNTMGLVRRRHFATEGRRLLGIEDEVFGVLDGTGAVIPDGADGADGAVADGDGMVPAGTGTLLTALERARSGRMRDIVATVQKEQDEVIRADLAGVLVVQGGPGTGKTAVALHRAAYLLYTHRFPLERQGVLVVGPNPLFLRYIEQVLPSLGENGVVLSTIAGLVPDVHVKASDTPLAASVKSGPRMAKLVADAVADRQRPLRRDVEVGFEGFALRISADATDRIVSAMKRRPGTHNARRRQVEGLLSRLLHQQYRQAAERRRRAGLGRVAGDEGDSDGWDDEEANGDGGEELGSGGVSEAALWPLVRGLQVVAESLDRMWPVLTPEELLHDLFGAPALVRLAARGMFTEEEQAALVRPRSDDIEAIGWTAGDLPLLDEARVLLGPRRPGARRAAEIRQYGHIVVDEAQDLTPMQLRMLGRRSISGSMTVVGDVAQATGARAPSSWDEIVAHLPRRRPGHYTELSVNYRTPAEMMDFAAKVLAVAAPHLNPPRSVRSTGEPPVILRAGQEELAERVAAAAHDEAMEVPGGTVAVVTVPSMLDELAAALVAKGIAFTRADRQGIEAAVTLIPVATVKGLEFDAVVVVEPARIVSESAQGLRALYVALTRATKRLTIVHAKPLPEPLLSP